jgi:hypothetical protein
MKKTEWMATLLDAKLVQAETWAADVMDSRGREVIGIKWVNKK